MKQEVEIEICIELVNLIENQSISNEYIIEGIQKEKYVEKAIELDKHRVDKQPLLYSPSHSLTGILERIISTLTNCDQSLPIYLQRYKCNYVDISNRLIQSCENLDVEQEKLMEYISLCEYDILQRHLSLYTIAKILTHGDINMAVQVTQKIKTDDYQGWRLVADYYGKRGEEDNFFKALKKCNARKDRGEIYLIKRNFIEQYSKTHTWDESLQMTSRKEFGNEYLYSVMLPYTKKENLDTLMAMMSSYPAFDTPALYLKEEVLTKAFETNISTHTKENFETLYNMIKAVPIKARAGDFSLRDNQFSFITESLMDDNKELFKTEIERAIKAISSPILKRNIKERLKCQHPTDRTLGGIKTVLKNNN